jgi:GTP cyclohydrolase I
VQKFCKEDIKKFINFIGDDPNRDELKNTPDNVLESIKYCFSGYSVTQPEKLINKIELTQKNNDIILIKNIDFFSFCEHHILPIFGKISIGYIADRYITGIGSLIKVVNCYTKRLQIQERICMQIATLLDKLLEPHGVAVIIDAKHMCAMCNNNILFTTIHKTGVFNEDNNQLEKFISLINTN